jgi:hypothetical protein
MKFNPWEKALLIILGLLMIGSGVAYWTFLTSTPAPEEFPVPLVYTLKCIAALMGIAGILMIFMAFKRK